MPDLLTPNIDTATERLTLRGLAYGDRRFAFSRGLAVRATDDDGYWTFRSDDPELVGFGHSRGEAELAFQQDFAACWDRIAQEDDDKLARGARELKRTLLALAVEL
jgi:hypothetical protein